MVSRWVRNEGFDQVHERNYNTGTSLIQLSASPTQGPSLMARLPICTLDIEL